MGLRAVVNGRYAPWYVHYGVTEEFWRRMQIARVFVPYHKQRDTAKARGIAWHFNPATWFAVWEASGRWSRRGARKGAYCMCRFGDVGPYSAENVEISPFEKNCSDRQQFVAATGMVRVTNSSGQPGVRRVPSNRFVAKIGSGGVTRHLGTFDTFDEAKSVYLAAKRSLYPQMVSADANA